MSQSTGADDAMEKGKAGTFDVTTEGFQKPSPASTQETAVVTSKDNIKKESSKSMMKFHNSSSLSSR